MTITPQPTVVPRVGGWSIAIAFRDVSGNPVDLTTGGLTPNVDFYQPNLGFTTPLAVSLTNAAAGQAVALVPQSVVQSTLAQPAGLLDSLFGTAASGPCRVEAYVVDGQGVASPPVVGFIQPLDWRTADPTALPAPPMMVVPVGPAGKQGDPGQQGANGVAGSADPQSTTAAGAIALHQPIYLDNTGALPASSDQPGQIGRVLGLAVTAAALGQAVTFSVAGALIDPAWNWTPGPIFLGPGSTLTQVAPASGFVQQLAIALSPTSLRMAIGRPVMIDVPPGWEGPTYRDEANGVEVLRAVVNAPGTPGVLGTTPDGWFPQASVRPGSLGGSKLGGGPQLASLPNGCFEDGFDGWSTSTSGTAEVSIDIAMSAVGRQSAYLHCPAPGDVAAVASGLVPCGEGVPVYVAARALLRSGAARVVLSALWYDRNGQALPGGPVQVGAPLALTSAFTEVGGYMLPPVGTRYAAAVISNTGTVGAVGAINVDEAMIHRIIGGPAGWQVLRAIRTAVQAKGHAFGDFLATLDDAEATTGLWEAAHAGMPAPVGGLLWGAVSVYLQSLGAVDPDLTAQLSAIWAAATPILPSPGGAPSPPPAVVSAKTSQVLAAAVPVLALRGGSLKDFLAIYCGDPDGPDRSWLAVNIDPTAPVGGVLYSRLLSFLTDAPAKGLGQPLAQSTTDLAGIWTVAPSITS